MANYKVQAYLVLKLLLFPTTLMFAQQRLFTNQQHFGVEEGLPQSFISSIVQDEDGFLWMATLDGICRYDGRGFKTIRHNPKDSTTIAANVINNFGRLHNNTITIHYIAAQVDNFNLRTFKASRNNVYVQLNKMPNARLVSTSGENWLFMTGDYNGMGWLNSKTGKVAYANRANGMLQQDTINAIVESAEGNIYLISKNGVQVSDNIHRKFKSINFTTQVKKKSLFSATNEYRERFSSVALPRNRLAISDSDKIIILNIDKRTSKVITAPLPASSAVYSPNSELKVDSRGHVYFANSGRIFRVAENGEFQLLWENDIDPTLRITAFFIDRSEVLWVSVNAQGLLKIDLQASLFHSYAYRAGFVADILELAGLKPGPVTKQQTDKIAATYFRHAWDSSGNLFLGSPDGGNQSIYHLNERSLRQFPHSPVNSYYSAIVNMPDNAIWGFDNFAKCWYSWKTPSSIPEKLQLDTESLKGVELTDARFIGGSIWMATDNHGLLQYHGTKRINTFAGKLPNGIMPHTLTEICPDPVDKNKFWIGSRGGGLIQWDVQKGLQRIYTVEDGLPNNTIYCILPDKAGKIWCSTNKGIFRFNAATGQVTAFEKTDGLPGNEFNRAHKLMLPDGRLAFGGLDGYTVFNPAELIIKSKRDVVPVQLTGLQINNEVQDFHLTNSLVKEPLSIIKDIDLPYNKNNLRFEFAALVFNQPQKIKYRYQLEGANEDWIENGTSNIASYAALRPGSYTFRINATDANGQWSDTIKEMSVNIHPPFWFTWWAYLIYGLIAIGFIRWYFIFREERLKTEQSLVFEKREAIRLKEMDEVKDRFFSNITHEFRTPLTLIISPLEKLMQDETLPAPAINTIKTAQRNSKQLLHLINEFLDFSKLNVGQMKVKLSAGELALFAADCVQSFGAAAADKNIRLSFLADGVKGLYLFDEDKWGKIISNLLSNALKFTPQNGEVSVSLHALEENKVRLEVKDTGHGIPLAQQQKIFDRFYQVDDSAIRNHGGTGIGLSLVKELTELMQGSIALNSDPGSATSFVVVIPVQKMQVNGSAARLNGSTVDRPIHNKTEAEMPLLLVVEDNDELRAFLIDSLQHRYRVIQAADGLQAWDIILHELPDIIISDVMMPGRDGFDLCNLCKSDNRTSHIGFILLTSKAAHDARLKGLSSCADDYITKPFHLDELELRAANILQSQQKIREHLQAQMIPAWPQVELPEVTNPFLAELYKEIEEKIDDAQLGVDYLCKTMAMSRSTLNRKLKSLLDISPNDLVRQYRLQKATGYLSAGIDISTAAYKVGFSSPSYFSQCFKEYYGITPSEWLSRQD